MSTQRRRVLGDDGGLTTITDNGVYIEGLNGKFYTVDNWHGGNAANSVAVVSGDNRFRVALTEAPSAMALSSSAYDPLGDYIIAISDEAKALADYNGPGNTTKILQMQPSTSYAAGYCRSFTFPNKILKGNLPSLGQLNLVYLNRAAVKTALMACGGIKINTNFPYASSTYRGSFASGLPNNYWVLDFSDAYAGIYGLDEPAYVRPFATLF